MSEERDENNEELKLHKNEEVKVENSVIPPVIGQPDVTALHHSSNSEEKVFTHENDEYSLVNPVDARHLDTVYQYTSKIRQFIGLVDPNEDKPPPIPSTDVEKGEKLEDESNQNLRENDAADEKLTDLNQDKKDPDSATVDVNQQPENPTIDDADIENRPVKSLPITIKETEKPNTDSSGNKETIASEECQVLNEDKNDPVFTTAGVNEETENPTSAAAAENIQKKSAITIEAETPKIGNSGSNEIIVSDVSSGNNDQISSLNENCEHILSDGVSGTLPNTIFDDYPSELNQVSDLIKDSTMPNPTPDDKMNAPLLESDKNVDCSVGVDLNKPEDVLKNEENITEKGESFDSNILTPKNPEKTSENSDENESSTALQKLEEILNGDTENVSSNEDSNFVEKNDTNNLSSELYAISEEQDNCVTSEEIEQTPHFENIRRLSVEIVNKVLDTAGTQLRDILNEKRKSNADANNLLERSPNSENGSFSHEGEFKASNFESFDVSDVKEKSNLKMSEGDRESSLSSEQPQVRHKLNNEIQLKEVLAKTYDFNDFQKKIEVEMNKFDPAYDIDPDTVCGIGCFKPRWIQPWATPRVYLVLYSIIGILSGSYYSYLVGAMSTLEKRFAFKSKTSGMVMMLDELTPLLLGILVGYYGGKSHRPRMVGLGMLLSSICCFISALPYFMYGPATHLSLGYSKIDNEKKLDLCNTEERESFCDDEDRLPTLTPVLLLMLGSFLKGFGNLSYYAVGLAYMDDNSKKKNTPLYFGIAFSLRLLGPVLGFLMSSFFLKYYENPFVDPGFKSTDPRWIGCWWLGFLVQGILLLIFTIPIFIFPRRLPGTVDYSKSEDQHSLPSFVGLLAALKRLAKNPVYVLLNLNVIMGVYGSFGHYIMLPRYMENQFRLSASTSSLISSTPSLGAVMISMTIGGYLIWKYKPGAKFLAAALCATEAIQVCTYLILMIPRCDKVELTSYGLDNNGLILQSECNSNCNCTTSAFSPVCGPDGATMFFSPCHAGCSEKVNGTYQGCSCVFDSSGQQRDYVTEGFCMSEDCWPRIFAYILTMPAVQLVVSLVKVGHTMIFLRSIKPEDKSVALGTFETFICLFGFIPYPVVYGALVDSVCLVWEKSCGETGNCWYYDVPKLNYILHGASAFFSTFDALTLLAIFFLASRVPDLYKEDYATEIELNTQKNEAEPQGERKDSAAATNL